MGSPGEDCFFVRMDIRMRMSLERVESVDDKLCHMQRLPDGVLQAI